MNKSIKQLVIEMEDRRIKAAQPSPLMSDPFVTMCAYDQEHVIRKDPNNHKFTTREK